LPKYDIQDSDPVMKKWHALLTPVLDQFAASANGNPDLEFWDTVCSHSGGDSGPEYLSGWVTVFACFKVNGSWQGNVAEKPCSYDYDSRKTPQKWPRIDTSDIPSGAVSVPVLVDDNGTQYATQMLTGQFAYEMTGNKNTVRRRTDWCTAYEGHRPKEQPSNFKHSEILPSHPSSHETRKGKLSKP
jgi:hypothetical protein